MRERKKREEKKHRRLNQQEKRQEKKKDKVLDEDREEKEEEEENKDRDENDDEEKEEEIEAMVSVVDLTAVTSSMRKPCLIPLIEAQPAPIAASKEDPLLSLSNLLSLSPSSEGNEAPPPEAEGST